jgi:hypothetical protein
MHTAPTSAVSSAAVMIRVFLRLRTRACCSSAASYETFIASRNVARRRQSSVATPLPAPPLLTPVPICCGLVVPVDAPLAAAEQHLRLLSASVRGGETVLHPGEDTWAVRLDVILGVQVDEPDQGQVEVDKGTFNRAAGPSVDEPVDGPANPRPALERFAVFLHRQPGGRLSEAHPWRRGWDGHS